MQTPRRNAIRRTPIAHAIGALSLLGPLCAHSALAATVTNCNDSGGGSLRAALAAASSGDTISLAALPACTITLTTAALPVTVNSLKVVGPVSNTVTINAAQNFRAFHHTGTGTLTLDHLVITNGKYRYANANGGCVVSSGSVSLHSTTMTGCLAYGTSSKAWGGAIAAVNTVTLVNSTLSNNLAEAPNGAYGGAVFANSVDIQYSTISNNVAQYPDGKDVGPSAKFEGGGVFVGNGSASVVHSHIDGNQLFGRYLNGAGVFASGSIYVGASSVSGNTSYGTGKGQGGGLCVAAALTLSHSTISGNQIGENFGSYGGGFRAGSVAADYTTISGNTLGSGPNGFSGFMEGGGMFVYQGSTNINHSTIDNNSVGGTGGGIFGFHSNITLKNSTVSGNQASGNGAVPSGSGAGIAMSWNANTAATLALFNTTIAFNSVYTSFGPYDGAGVRAYGTLISQSSIIANNTKHGVPSDLSCNCGTNASKQMSGSNNLIEVVDLAGIAPPAGMVILSTDPQLAPLAFHGGETRVHALLATSPAIGVGNDVAGYATDQRGIGYPRLNSGLADIGAYERQPNDDEIFYSGLQ